ncbi:DNA-directed RNA polymerases IV and V subunit 2 [Arabidopsis lyrata subsp. lyrata]|uniref:DNA-directed RNA polymerases IV and V subunit 2 n=1 Tax=Arabidopsis lyrata subsp. lyrata TaxID=81972 RepID=UPI000A29E40F|nr:DNA-directed RNA polymerases IV and V subunit 2 [Arabidopsis lyrata subsp. lyrata]|eukprot:XP_020887712.1 DNA-directed RNA polymerases IV and V subunit 2 [Arabidopsis lyrata subsp. lyrata]
MDIDEMDIEEIEATAEINLSELGESFLQSFCKKAATSFFDKYGLISHQLNSYNFFIQHGLQDVFESFGDMLVEPSFDVIKKKDNDWRYATVKFGKVTVEKPTFFSDDKELEFLPWHARLQNMTYSARIKVNVQVEVFIKTVVKSDKFKTGQDEYVEKKILEVKKQDILIGSIPVMVKSVLCKTSEKGKENCRKGDCAFDQGGYFVIKGAEKVFIAQEQMCTKRLWISNSPWTVSFRSENKRNRFIVRLSENEKSEDYKKREKVLTVYFLSTEIPVWLLFFALGVSSDKEAMNLIAFDGDDASITNSLIASIHEADAVCEAFRCGNNALSYVEQQIKPWRPGWAGFSRWGNERVYNGRSGEMMRSLIFMGPTFYQRLVHMSEDKVKFRNTGPVHPLTRQQVADRKRFGGIRFGEMERDCLIAHGASANLHERLFTLSDSSQMHICRKCKTYANVIERTPSSGRKIRGPYCRVCVSSDHVVRVYVPYGAKLLCQELFSMGITLNFDTKLC